MCMKYEGKPKRGNNKKIVYRCKKKYWCGKQDRDFVK